LPASREADVGDICGRGDMGGEEDTSCCLSGGKLVCVCVCVCVCVSVRASWEKARPESETRRSFSSYKRRKHMKPVGSWGGRGQGVTEAVQRQGRREGERTCDSTTTFSLIGFNDDYNNP
jgi:hypothetical protein